MYLEWIHYLWSAHPMHYPSWIQQHTCWSRVTSRPPTRGENLKNGFKMYYRTSNLYNDISKYKVENFLLSEHFLIGTDRGTTALSKYLNFFSGAGLSNFVSKREMVFGLVLFTDHLKITYVRQDFHLKMFQKFGRKWKISYLEITSPLSSLRT